ncbi:hypothetical protein BDW42DRAFT_120329 [Aspergillus taichungensis]|uniref:Uncharacterized protein n=1 Tax=Aspergillus taichungensis TaxID=482145 RepID=A0A2J5I7C7_9EURO|nr:hypothetical protein BDW42DRAFT_120329 [Aspergillus taichungensis]
MFICSFVHFTFLVPQILIVSDCICFYFGKRRWKMCGKWFSSLYLTLLYFTFLDLFCLFLAFLFPFFRSRFRMIWLA